jgi:20S proteasome, alpha and beta subunits
MKQTKWFHRCTSHLILVSTTVIMLYCINPVASRNTNTHSKANNSYPSPPCMGAKCKDGIVLLSIHIREHDDVLSGDITGNVPLLDNIGPVRIEQLDENLMLVNSGWRTDGHALADKGRELCKNYSILYGNEKGNDFGRYIGWGLVDYLVEYHCQESVRSLSTSGLLATYCANQFGLYLVDICGLFPCRALAIGSHAQEINKYLGVIDFVNISVQEGANELLSTLRNYAAQQSKLGEEIVDKDTRGRNVPKWQIPNDSIVEIVFLKPSANIIRKRVAFLNESVLID